MIEVHYSDFEQHKCYIKNGQAYVTSKIIHEWLKKYKKEHCCEICGTKKNLTVHHTIPSKKIITYGNLVKDYYIKHQRIYPIHIVKRDLKRCQLICDTCHRKINGEIKNEKM